MRTRSIFAVCLAATLGSAAPVGAQAATTDLLSQFNAIVFGNFSNTSDVQGRTVVGGNMTGGATFGLNALSGVSSYSGLTVYGNETSGGSFNVNHGEVTILGSNQGSFTLNNGGDVFVGGANSGNLSVSGSAGTVGINGNNTGQVTLNSGGTVKINGNSGNVSLNGGSLTYAGNKTGNLNINNGASATQGPVSVTPTSSTPDFNSTFETPMKQLSSQLAGLTATSAAPSGSSNTITAAPDSAGMAVLDVSSTQVSSLFRPNTTLNIDLNGASSLVINVTLPCSGTNCSLNLPSSFHFNNPKNFAQYVIWNFTNATSLYFPIDFGGTVLSPYATVTNTTPIEGTLVAAAYTGQGELHNHPFTGTLNLSTSNQSGSGTPVPEPSSLALFGAGLAGLGLLRRRRSVRTA